MLIKIDSRERKVYNLLVNNNCNKKIELKTESLLLGDFIISNDKEEKLLVIEKKHMLTYYHQ